ncbi:MAG: hypothetical protein HOL04_03140 [Gammaproteobacteria bacterium]|jgi:hypothetical protein|nr:hypothetical protein [Gammaproteobacteria bacterium]MBT4606752.1 hypothetical protein [Thiotrichales bacterium]MBT3967621.1 hypothetical protein [Gammaproteobacteria bacterium]MBT4081251.1 hypothetical protein [Gammaproteobacteria bacterium]MBT4328398.1 hypothetical protein [Gammaproteobacteria bacterium]
MRQTVTAVSPEAKVWSNNRWGKVIGTKDGTLIVQYENRNRRKSSATLQREIELFTAACNKLH